MTDKYVPLHLHSIYSIYDGLGTVQEYAQKAAKYGHRAMALTDHGRMGGIVEHRNACLKNGIKPIVGIEAYATNKLVVNDDKGKRKRTKNNHVILLAKNEKGYKNILRLNYLSNKDEEHYYYNPRISFEELFTYSEGIVCGSACLASSFANLLKYEKEKEAEELFVKFIEVFKDDFYAEIQLNEVNIDEGGLLSRGQISYNKWLIEKATRFGVPIVAAGDVHYINKEDYKTQELSFNLRADKEEDEEFVCKSLYYHKTEDFLRFNKDFGYNYKESDLISWVENSCYIADKIDFIIPERDRMFLPRMSDNEEDDLVRKAVKGLTEHFNVNDLSDVPEEYRNRLKHELSLILRKGISRYFLVLNDICEYADSQDITRGSARGCFLPGNIVSMLDGTKEIQNIKAKEKIFTGFGSKSYVDTVFEYDIKEDISVLKTDCGEISSTKDHEILVLKKGLEKKKENLRWVKASDIIPGDFLVKDYGEDE